MMNFKDLPEQRTSSLFWYFSPPNNGQPLANYLSNSFYFCNLFLDCKLGSGEDGKHLDGESGYSRVGGCLKAWNIATILRSIYYKIESLVN